MSDTRPRFEGQTAFLTGGGTGIGLACAEALVAGGALVMLVGRRQSALDEAVAKLGDAAQAISCDVTAPGGVEAAVEETVSRFGGLTLAVNAAGAGMAGSVRACTPETFSGVLDVNLTGVYRALRAEARVIDRKSVV